MACKPTYKGVRYNSLEELYRANGINPQQKQQAQQLYSQYLDSLNKPNTNPILQTNQQEQVKKFAELQERLNNKEFLEGAKNAYENSEKLKSFGTQEEYNDYIARVSLGIIKNPSSGDYNYNSRVKDIVYHGSNQKIEKFNKPTAELSLGKPAIYFRKDYNKHIKDSKVSTSVIVNSEFPFIADDFLDYQERRSKRVFFDSVYIKNEDEFAVFEPEQIHILGSKKDIEGFKEFVRKSLPLEQQEQLKQKESNLQEYNKVKKAETMEEVKAQMLKDFDSYYPQFKDLLSWEKEMFIDMMSEGEINTYC